jgi:thiamine pyrophosphokinase
MYDYITKLLFVCVCVCVCSQNNFERKSISLLLEMNFMSHQNVFLQDDTQTITSLKTGKITVQYTLIFTFLNVLQFKDVYNF